MCRDQGVCSPDGDTGHQNCLHENGYGQQLVLSAGHAALQQLCYVYEATEQRCC